MAAKLEAQAKHRKVSAVGSVGNCFECIVSGGMLPFGSILKAQAQMELAETKQRFEAVYPALFDTVVLLHSVCLIPE